jgi:NAD+ kinase
MAVVPPWVRQDGSRPRAIVLGSGDRPQVSEQVARLQPFLEKHLELVLIDLQYQVPLEKLEADLVIVFGGDGSILRAAKQLGERQIPVLGVNLGRLGFLADLQPDEFMRVLPAVCAGRCTLLDHLMLTCTVHRNGRISHEELGLNEASILAAPPFSMLYLDLYVDGELATTYSCDGLILSTPVGSTAHNLSAGGPIIRKNLPAFVISPINPHTLTVRPVVDSADRVFEILVRQPQQQAMVLVDGRMICELTEMDRVRVQRAKPTFQLIEVEGHNYYRTLREKLGWGGNLPNR